MEAFDFLSPEVTQGHLVSFSDTKVNLSREHAQRYREQVNNLRDHLDRYVAEHPTFGLGRMLLSGSLAKGTALSSINDIDVAIYLRGAPSDSDRGAVLEWLVQRLRTTYSTMSPNNIYIDGPCIVISFSGTGLNVEVAPIYDLKDKDGRGYLWDRQTGDRILTSIPLHLEFIRKRKERSPTHFAQVVRLLKWWAKQRSRDQVPLEIRSFLIELLSARLSDTGYDFSNYHDALESFFQYIVNTQLRERVAFYDNYSNNKLPAKGTSVVEIFDPVNPANNVAKDISDLKRRNVVKASEVALDALAYAKTCQNKSDAISCWQDLMGPTFSA